MSSGAWWQPVETETYDAPPEEAQKVSYIEGKVKAADDARPRFIRSTYLNNAFVLGDQWFTWNDYTRTLNPPNVDPWQVTMVKNYTLPIVQTAIGKLTQADPSWIAVPRSDEESDAQRARLAQKLLDALHRLLDMSTKVGGFVYWMLVSGIGIYRVQWGAAKKDGVELPDVQPVSPLQWLCDPGAERRDLSDCQWAAEQCYESVAMLRERYPDRAKYIRPNGSYGSDSTGLTMQLTASAVSLGSSPDQQNADRTRVIYYYERPSLQRPEGVYAVVACGMVLREDVLPLGRLPYVVARHNAVGSRLIGDGMVNSMRGPQTAVNKYESVLMETVDLVATPKWSVEKGSVPSTAFTREPGEVVEYEQGSRPPEPLPSPPVPAIFAQVIASSRDTLQEVSGISEISQGLVQTNISGRAAQRLAELDATKFGPTTRELEAAYNDLGEMLVELWRQYADEEVTLRVVGKNNLPDVTTFRRSDLDGISMHIVAGSMRVKHPSVEQEKVLMMFERGALGNPQDPKVLERVQRAMEFGDGNLEAGEVRGETAYAREENFAIMVGEGDPRVLPTDDHSAHIAEHRALLRTDEVRTARPEVVELVLEHIAAHEVYYASEQGRPFPAWATKYVPDLVAELQPPPPPGAEEPGEAMEQEEPGEVAEGGAAMMRPTAMPFDEGAGMELGAAPPMNLPAGALPPMLPQGPGVE